MSQVKSDKENLKATLEKKTTDFKTDLVSARLEEQYSDDNNHLGCSSFTY